MKAFVHHNYGSPNVLKLQEIEKPTPKEGQVLVKVQAASVNPLDWHTLRGEPFLVRLTGGLLKPKNKMLGADIAGRIEALGENATQFQPDDEVFGRCGSGGFAEHVCVSEKQLALKPAKATFEEAAAVPVAALTALQGLRDQGSLQPGQKVLLNGASGGVGTFAVQIAKSFQADVTGVCGTGNVDLVRSLGADQVIDHTREDFTRNGRRYDLILDAVGNCSLSDYKRALSPDGICVVIGFSNLLRMFQIMLLGPRSKGVQIGLMMAKINKKDLVFMKELLESGKVTPVIDRSYTFSEVPEALRYLEAGHAKGKVVVTV